MGHRSSRVQPFTDSEQVHDLQNRDRTPGSNPSSGSSSTAEKHLPHRPDEKKTPEEEADQLPISRLKKKKKKVGNFFKSLSFRWKKESTEKKSSDQGDMMKDQETETSRKSTDDQKSLQSSRSVEVIDLEEPPVDDPEVLPAAEPLVQEELQTQVHDAPVRLTAGETSPLRNQLNMRPEDDIYCRYAIGCKLGQGGFGAVYEGTRLADGQKVAVKCIQKTESTEYISIPDHPEPLPKEVALTILASKKGPAMDIIKLLDWQDQEDFYVMVLERFSHCMDVFEFVKRNGGSIEEKIARHIMWSATLAADACCRRGVYHGDIKLENLLINVRNHDVTLIDFGCSDLLTESAYTRYCGTVRYCPPEYRMYGEFHGKPATVWSLGILLFRMVCGYFPDSFDFYRTNMNTWYKPDLTEECCELICSLLQQNPEHRLGLDRIILHKWF
ncbi:serine/threonine-protein kinase pim-2-like [Siphateles boraxobius]|uniref:serine/threonine-protein kinase pim-2-like n=2 Tax=Siphateles boraxobius TaxID=180520 RepID=UPI00406483C0